MWSAYQDASIRAIYQHLSVANGAASSQTLRAKVDVKPVGQGQFIIPGSVPFQFSHRIDRNGALTLSNTITGIVIKAINAIEDVVQDIFFHFYNFRRL